jgi:CheY-like chemotaxis protein
VDLLITDVVMPGMNGLELARECRRLAPGLALLFVSGDTSGVLAARGILGGEVEFLPKPIPPEKTAPPKARSVFAVADFTDRTVARRGAAAADQLDAIVRASDRFDLMDRREARQRQAEQESGGAGGVTYAGKRGIVPGADYVFGGSIDQFRVTLVSPGPGAPAMSDVSKQEVVVDVGIGIQLLQVASGDIVAKERGQWKKQALAGTWNIRVLGIGGNKELQIDNESAAKILRQALDPLYKKMQPAVEEKLGNR